MIRALFNIAVFIYRRIMPQAFKQKLWHFFYKIGAVDFEEARAKRQRWARVFDGMRSIQNRKTAAGFDENFTEDMRRLWSGKPEQRAFRAFLLNHCMTFDFNGAKIPNFLSNSGINRGFDDVVIDTFLVPLFFGDCYRRELVEQLDEFMPEGPYGWQDDGFDVTVHKGDIVIDAGAWIGDFAAYAASKGATVYAFEPTAETFAMLEETARLNGPITPVQKGLSDKTGSIELHTNALTGGNSLLSIHGLANTETISITTLDDFVRDNNIPRVDFIKADIEGAERDMLKGARHVLKTFAPRLALCTYHLPDDPEVMARLIMEANPDYQIVQRGKKLYASVPLLVLAENS